MVCVDGFAGSCGIEEFADELDLALNAWLFVMDVVTFGGSHRLNPAQSCFGRSQGSKALSVTKQSFHDGMIALGQVVLPLTVDMSDAVEVRIVAMIDFANDTPIGLGFIRHNCHRAMQPHTLNRFVQKGLGGFRVSSSGQAEIDHLTVCIDHTP